PGAQLEMSPCSTVRALAVDLCRHCALDCCNGATTKPVSKNIPAGSIKAGRYGLSHESTLSGKLARVATDNPRLRPRPCACPNGNRARTGHKRRQAEPLAAADNTRRAGEDSNRAEADNNPAADSNNRAAGY